MCSLTVCPHSDSHFLNCWNKHSLCLAPDFITALLKLKGLPLFSKVEIHYINVSDVYFTNLCCRTLQRERKTSNGDKGRDGDADSLILMYYSTRPFWSFFLSFFNIFLMTWISLNKEVQEASSLSFTDNSVSPCRRWCQRRSAVPKSNPVCISGRYQHLKLGRMFQLPSL